MPYPYVHLVMVAVWMEMHREWVRECDRAWSRWSRFGRG